MSLYPPEELKDAPRRYFVDGDGHRVLVGLTFEETFEFEALDGPAAGAVDACLDEVRWRALYDKHVEAWKDWMAKAGSNHRENLHPLN